MDGTGGRHAVRPGAGAAGYTYSTTVAFGGVPAKYVRIIARSSWGGGNQYGLSEVRFYHVPMSAREPQPASGAADAGPEVVLKWRPGREAAKHDVYLGLDEGAVLDGTAPTATVTTPSFDAGTLQLASTYYWRVDEVNAAETPAEWMGRVWSFSTPEFLPVDDFEGYTNESPNRVFQTWVDGAGFSADTFFPNGNPGNGSGRWLGTIRWRARSWRPSSSMAARNPCLWPTTTPPGRPVPRPSGLSLFPRIGPRPESKL